MPTPEELQTQVDELTEKLNTEVENAKKQRKAKQDLQSKLDEFQAKLGELEAAKKAADDEAERVRLESEGKYQEALEKARSQHGQELADRDTKIGQLTSAFQHEFGTNRLIDALGKAGVKSELLTQASRLLGSQVKVGVKDGKPVTEVFDESGVPLMVDGNPATVEQLVKQWLPGNQHFLPPSGDSGSGTHAGAGGDRVTVAYLDAHPEEKRAFINKHGRDAFLKKARDERLAAKE